MGTPINIRIADDDKPFDPRERDQLYLPIPVGNFKGTMQTVELRIPQPMLRREWEQLFETLQMMKPVLIEPDHDANEALIEALAMDNTKESN